MTEEARRCAESCREWYQAFSNFGKGEERSVKDLLAVADLIESLSAQLEQVTQEREAMMRLLRKGCRGCESCRFGEDTPENNSVCDTCKPKGKDLLWSNWQWRGVEVEG